MGEVGHVKVATKSAHLHHLQTLDDDVTLAKVLAYTVIIANGTSMNALYARGRTVDKM